MAYEYEGEYWLDPNSGKLLPRWVWPCADEANPDNEFILGHMHKATDGPGSGKLVPRFQGEDITGYPPAARDGISVQDCPGGNWTGYNKKVGSKLRPYLTLPGTTLADVSGECECETGDWCYVCSQENCADKDCDFTWGNDSSPLTIPIRLADIVLCGWAILGDGDVNTTFNLIQTSWWSANDPATYPTVPLGFPAGDFWSPSVCKWGYVDDGYNENGGRYMRYTVDNIWGYHRIHMGYWDTTRSKAQIYFNGDTVSHICTAIVPNWTLSCLNWANGGTGGYSENLL